MRWRCRASSFSERAAAVLGLLPIPEGLSVEPDLAGIIFFEKVDAAEQRRLSATAAADQGQDLALADGEIDTAQYLHRAKGFAEAANLDHSRSPAKPLSASRSLQPPTDAVDDETHDKVEYRRNREDAIDIERALDDLA